CADDPMPASTTSPIATSAFLIFPSAHIASLLLFFFASLLRCFFTSLLLYFCLPAHAKSGGRNFLPPFLEQPVLGRREVRVVHFVGFAAMALTAELRHRVAGRAGWVVVAADEEHRVESARGAADRAGVDRHAVLVVASGAVYRGVDTVKRHGAHGETIVLLELREVAACWGHQLPARNRAIPVVRSAAADRGQGSYRVIVLVVALAIAVVAEPRRSVAADRIRDRFDGGALHHSVHCQIAVMAA